MGGEAWKRKEEMSQYQVVEGVFGASKERFKFAV